MLNGEVIKQFLAAALISSIVNSVSGNDTESVCWRMNSFSFTIFYLWLECTRVSTKQFNLVGRVLGYSRFLIYFVGAVIRLFNFILTFLYIGNMYEEYFRSMGNFQILIALGVRFVRGAELH